MKCIRIAYEFVAWMWFSKTASEGIRIAHESADEDDDEDEDEEEDEDEGIAYELVAWMWCSKTASEGIRIAYESADEGDDEDEGEEEDEDDSLRGSDKFWVRYEVYKGENKREVNQQLFSKSHFQVIRIGSEKIAFGESHRGVGFIRVKTSGKLTKSYFRKAIFEKLFPCLWRGHVWIRIDWANCKCVHARHH